MKMLVVQRRPVVVNAMLFERPDPPGRPQHPFRLDECGCDAMDGYTCGQHRREPEYSYHIGLSESQSIRPGQWAIALPDGRYEVLTDAQFKQRYEAAPQQEPT